MKGVFLQLIIDWSHISLLSLPLGFLLFEVGVISLGHAGLLLIGSYAIALFFLGKITILTSFFLVICFLIALSLSSIRVRGDIFALTSLAFSEALRLTTLGSWEITRGSLGLGPIKATWFSTDQGSLVLGLVFVFFATMSYFYIIKGWGGVFLGAIRDDEIVAQAQGLKVIQIRFFVVLFSGVIAIVLGMAQTIYFRSAYPNMGRLDVTLMALSAVMLAAPVWKQGQPIRVIIAILAGSAIIVCLPFFLRWLFPGSVDISLFRQIIFGSLLYLLVHPEKPLKKMFSEVMDFKNLQGSPKGESE